MSLINQVASLEFLIIAFLRIRIALKSGWQALIKSYQLISIFKRIFKD